MSDENRLIQFIMKEYLKKGVSIPAKYLGNYLDGIPKKIMDEINTWEGKYENKLA